MIKRLQKNVNKRSYKLYHNGEEINIIATRVKGFKNYINKIAKSKELVDGKAFFIYNEYNFASFGLSEEVDLVFVDWDGKITHTEELFLMNKISDSYKKTKYIYILPKNSIKKNKILTNDTLVHRYDRKKSEFKISDFI